MEEEKKEVLFIPTSDILPNRFQPRLTFDEKELNELASSILKYGVIQPIVVRRLGDKFEIIAGERRYKASVIAGLSKVPAIINEANDDTSAEIALLENIQRKDLTAIEEANSFKKLIDRGFTQDDIASKIGVSQSSIANKIRLLSLPNEVQEALLYNRISERHARSLLSLKDRDLQVNLLNRIINEKLTVKQAEIEVAELLNKDSIQSEEIPVEIEKFLKPQSEIKPEIEEPVVQNHEETTPEKNGVDEFLEFNIPDVIDISEPKEEVNEVEEENLIINPFQQEESGLPNIESNLLVDKPFTESKEDLEVNEEITPISNDIEELPVIDQKPIIEEQPIYTESNEPAIDINKEPDLYNMNTYEKNTDFDIPEEEESIVEEDGSIDLPNVINKVRNFVYGFNEGNAKLSCEEADLPDKYQIIINIFKD